MRTTLYTALAALAIGGLSLTANAGGTIDVKGVTYQLDTVFHAKIGPGTTQTQLRLVGPSNGLDVFYLTIDKSTPGVSIRAVCAKDKVAGTMRTSDMAKGKTTGNLDYFCGTNADFFTTSGSASNGSSKVGSPSTSCTVDGEIYKTSNSQYQFSVDVDGVARICRLNYYTGTATLSDKQTLFKGVNVGAPNNGITIYTDRYWGSANQTDYAGKSYQVTAKLAADGGPFLAGHKFRMEVTSEPTTDGDAKITAGNYVIFARGNSSTGTKTGAMDFVKSLKPGDIIDFDNIVLANGEPIVPYTIVSGNPKNVGEGQTLDTESERNDAKDRHPRTSIGISQDGNKIIMMVIDGRSSSSAGVSTSMSADIMRYAGAWESVNLDGGGSSTLYTEALGVRNRCSDGNERAVGNAIFGVLEAPADDQVAELSFMDWAKTLPQYGIYVPTVYAYNKYGKLIDIDFKDFTLSCEGGEPRADGGIMLTKTGTHALTASYNGISCSIPVTVVSDGIEIAPRYDKVLLNSTREWTAELQAMVDGKAMVVAAPVFSWTSSDADVARVDENGVVRGVSNGTAVITGKLGEKECVINLTVEIPAKTVLPVNETATADTWTIKSKTAMKTATVTPLENGFALDFMQSTTRGPRIVVGVDRPLYSLPEAVQLRLNPGKTPLTSIGISVRAANAAREVDVLATEKIEASKENLLTFKIADILDTTDIGIYPVTMTRVTVTPNGKTSTAYHLDFNGVESVYNKNDLDGIEDITVSPDKKADSHWYNLQGIPVEAPTAPGMYLNSDGRKAIVK